MTLSMTGFGKAAGEFNGDAIAVEVSAVNHRYLDCSLRTPSAWTALEPVIKNAVKKRIARGKLSITIARKRTSSTAQTVCFDGELARQYIESARQLGEMLKTDESLSINTLAQFDGVFYREDPEEDLDAAAEAVVAVLNQALDALETMRRVEGAVLADDLAARVAAIREALTTVEAQLPELSKQYEERLHARIGELQLNASLTEERIAIEVALMAEKSDVTEEVVRLRSHLDQMDELLAAKEPVGRRLDFLSQEAQREVNTLGVKTRNGDVTREILTMKGELEKIREQVQNIE